MTSTAIVNKVWNFCHTLRDDGVGYGADLRNPERSTRMTPAT
jgi:hypothetical protein